MAEKKDKMNMISKIVLKKFDRVREYDFIAQGTIKKGQKVYIACKGKVASKGKHLIGRAITSAKNGQKVRVCC